MMKQMRKRNNRKGFSLTELLAAVLILSMVSAVVVGGIPVAKNAYEKVTVAANAQVMLSTTISALRNELCTASNATPDAVFQKLNYYNASTGGYSQIFKDGTIKLKRTAGSSARSLVPEAIGDGKLTVDYESVTCEDGIITFKDLTVKEGSKPYATMESLKIRLISPDLFLGTGVGIS